MPDIPKKHSCCDKCHSLSNSLFLCEELLLTMTFCTWIPQHRVFHLQPPNFRVLHEQQIPGNAEGALQRAELCSASPVGTAKTNWWPTRLHHSLDVTWTKLLMTIGLLWVRAHFFQVTKNEHWDLECAGTCLDSIVCWTEMNFSDRFKTPPRYQVSQECREKEHTRWRNRSDLEPMMPKRLLVSRGRRVYSSLAHNSHSFSQLCEREMSENKRKIQTQQRKSTIWQFSYNSSFLGLTQRKGKILKDGVNTKQNI